MAGGKLFGQLLILGLQILSRAAVEAYKQSMTQAAKTATSRMSANMTKEEAAKILAVDQAANMEQVVSRFKHLFEANNPQKGGSFYIQSKIVRARERFEDEVIKS